MKKFLPALLIWLILFSGCAASSASGKPIRETGAQETPDTIGQEPVREGIQRGVLRCYPLGDMAAAEMVSLGDGRLLLIQPEETTARLMLLEGDGPVLTAEARVPFPLSPEGSVAPWGDGISCFDSTKKETVLLDGALREVCRIPAPKGLLGWPLLSRDGTLLYYCTPDAIRVLELSGGISRVLKQTDCSLITLTGLLLEDSALVYTVTGEAGNQTILISAHTGETLYVSAEGETIGEAKGTLYIPESGAGVFGPPGGEALALYPRQASAQICFLPRNHGAVTLSSGKEDTVILEYYDLATGLRTGSLTLPYKCISRGIAGGQNGRVWLLGDDETSGCTMLYCWDPEDSPTGDPQVYTGAYFSREAPDWDDLSRCEAYARELGAGYGIEIRLWTAIGPTQPEGYQLEPEHHAPQLMRTLQLLEHCLAQYPPGFVQTVASRFDGLTLWLVRSIREQDSLEREGLQFWDGNHAVIALAVGSSAEGAFYHQLCHLIDTVVLSESSAYDTWQSLNPTGFRYDYSYIANRSRNSTAYLQEANRSFVDMFSMSFPREDRARIMEYAMLPGNEELFRSETMQRKLRALCLGIREAFELTDFSETFLWEQYLHE